MLRLAWGSLSLFLTFFCKGQGMGMGCGGGRLHKMERELI